MLVSFCANLRKFSSFLSIINRRTKVLKQQLVMFWEKKRYELVEEGSENENETKEAKVTAQATQTNNVNAGTGAQFMGNRIENSEKKIG